MSSPGEAPRRVALEAMLRMEDGAYAHILVPQLLRQRHLDARDRGLVTEMVYGAVRMQRALDWLVQSVASRPIPSLDPPVRAALRLGAYQLLIGIPAHAAVGETVNVVPARSRGFVNGVLRGLSRTGPPFALPEGDDIESIAIRASHPDWIVRTLFDAFGPDDARATLAVDNEAPAVTLRVNRMRTSPRELAEELHAAGIDVERGKLVDDALVLRHAGDLLSLAAISDGRATPQDQASQAIVAALDPQPGERVLDLAAAPGGKATATAEHMQGDGLVVAADLHPGRVRTVQRGVARVGLEHVIATLIADGRMPPVHDAQFDRVLLDAPCSGLGVLRRRPDARWRLREEDVEDLAQLQRAMLGSAAQTLKRGGRLVFSVCTLTTAETIDIDGWAAAELPDLVAEPPPSAPWRPHGRGAILLPSDANTDGMFVLVLKKGDASERPMARATVAHAPPEASTDVAANRPDSTPPPVPNNRRWSRVT
jgi:16S rRNA (cytosine967-C5)-methyltransferase